MSRQIARKLLLGGVAVVAFSSPAWAAQQAPGGTDVVPPAGTDAAAQGQDAPQAPQTASTEGDIIVTAQRREERAQDVPIVISAFSEERLEQLNITEPQDLYGTVPSLVSGNQGQAVRDVQSYSIRGQSTGFLASPGVQLYLSEVPLPSSISLNLQGAPGLFVDLQNVQVLSGPQGTLFGRNTTGGAVLFEPRKPSNNFEGYIEGSIGNYDLLAMEGALNIPVISDKLLVRIVGAHQSRRGYTKDLVWDKWRDDTNWYSGRVGITFKPTETLENYLLVYGAKSSNNGAGHIHGRFNIPGLIGRGYCTPGPRVPGVIASCDIYEEQTDRADEIGPRRIRGGTDGFSKISTWGAINTTSLDLTEELTLRNIISFQKLKDNYATDQDGTPIQMYELGQGADLPTFPIPGFAEFGYPNTPGNVYLNGTDGGPPRDYLKQFTEELQLQGTMLDNRLTFTVGGFYFNAKPAGDWGSSSTQFCPAEFTGQPTADTSPFLSFSCFPSDSRSGVSNKSKALYGQATVDFGVFSPSLENLRFTAGYRYTWDTIKGFSSAWARLDAPAVNLGTGALDPDTDFDDIRCSFGTTAGTILTDTLDGAEACEFGATLKSKASTWTVGLDYKPLRNVLVYGKISRGYKAGGFNTFAVRPETTTFLPEELTTYETGFKSDWRLGGRVPFRLNATYYYSKYNNIHRPGGDFNLANGAGGARINAAEATIQGFEVETSVRPVEAIEVGATVSHADGDYTKYELVSLGEPSCNGAGFLETADYSCAPFQFLTPWIYNIYTTIKLPVPERLGELSLFGSFSHVSEQYSAPGPFEPGGMLESYGLLNASLNWNGVAGSGLDASVFVTNLLDKTYRVSNANSFNGNLVLSSLYGEPRMYGLRLKYRFGHR